jgi:predicted esterase
MSIPADASEGRLHARPEDGTAASAPTATAEPQPLGLASDRDGYFYLPRSAADAALAPVVLFLHGAGGSGGRAIQRVLGQADRTGTIVIAPDSRLSTWGFSAESEGADLAFLDAALEKIFASAPVDPQRIAIAGFSDGASAALSWGLMNGDLFSAVAGFSPGFVHFSSPPRGTPRIFISHGTADSVLPIDRCGRRLARELRAAGRAVDYREFEGDHTIPPSILSAGWHSLVRRSG